MKDGKEIRWFCTRCMEDQTDDVWNHWNRKTGDALCSACTAKIPHNAGPEHYCQECKPGGINDIKGDTARDTNSNELQTDTGSDEIDVLKSA